MCVQEPCVYLLSAASVVIRINYCRSVLILDENTEHFCALLQKPLEKHCSSVILSKCSVSSCIVFSQYQNPTGELLVSVWINFSSLLTVMVVGAPLFERGVNPVTPTPPPSHCYPLHLGLGQQQGWRPTPPLPLLIWGGEKVTVSGLPSPTPSLPTPPLLG